MVVGVPLQVGAHDRLGLGGRQIGRRVQRRRVDFAQVPQQALLGDALGDPAQAALLHAAEKRLRLFDRLLMPRALGFLQLLVEPARASARRSPALRPARPSLPAPRPRNSTRTDRDRREPGKHPLLGLDGEFGAEFAAVRWESPGCPPVPTRR